MLKRAVLLGAVLYLILLASNAFAQERELPIATGEHWTTASERSKKAFLLGFGTLLKVERELQGANPPPDDESFIPRLAAGLKGYSLASAMEAIDGWYAGNPNQLDRPVIEVIWFELALPNLN